MILDFRLICTLFCLDDRKNRFYSIVLGYKKKVGKKLFCRLFAQFLEVLQLMLLAERLDKKKHYEPPALRKALGGLKLVSLYSGS